MGSHTGIRTARQEQCLAVLEETTGKTWTRDEMAERLDTTPAGAGRTLDSLVRRRFAKKIRRVGPPPARRSRWAYMRRWPDA